METREHLVKQCWWPQQAPLGPKSSLTGVITNTCLKMSCPQFPSSHLSQPRLTTFQKASSQEIRRWSSVAQVDPHSSGSHFARSLLLWECVAWSHWSRLRLTYSFLEKLAAYYSFYIFAFLAHGRFLSFSSHKGSSFISGELGHANPLFPSSLKDSSQ